MYTARFGLREPPFAITPDPAYVYPSRHHQEALAHLLYGASESGGFVQLTGEVGTGKTTLIRTLLEQKLENVDIALCLNPRLTVGELLATVCDELGVLYPRGESTLKPLLDALNAHLLQVHAAGRRTVLIIDEAQNLSREVLEQIRLLTNLETTKHKLLLIILVGQPELRQLLARPDLRQLTQRITARYHLPPLDRKETAAYIGHRVRVADGDEELFTPGARRVVYRRSGGIPRLINVICDRALLGAYGQEARCVTARLARQAAREVLRGGAAGRAFRLWPALAIGLAGLATIGGGLWLLQSTDPASAVSPRPAVEDVATTMPVPPAPAGSPPDWPVLLEQAGDAEGQRRLLAVWGIAAGVEADDRAPFCDRAKAHGLRCLSGRGDWESLRRYDRPALLRLRAPDGAAGQALLRTLTEASAKLEVAGETVEAPLEQLTPLWTGDYLLLWRTPVVQRVLGPGASGEEVRWLRQRLAVATGQTLSEPLPELFDAALAEQVRDFQRERGLQPDGLAGPRTLALLSGLAPEPDTPVLRAKAGED
ncbi:MAG: AAA family ATPase [Candidatus Competibacteraceae bacterium]|nr:AAA family ATPase [Candidatus Competibacteraceae bacterium]